MTTNKSRKTSLVACLAGAFALTSSFGLTGRNAGFAPGGTAVAAEGCGSDDVQAGEKKQGKSHVEIINGKRDHHRY